MSKEKKIWEFEAEAKGYQYQILNQKNTIWMLKRYITLMAKETRGDGLDCIESLQLETLERKVFDELVR